MKALPGDGAGAGAGSSAGAGAGSSAAAAAESSAGAAATAAAAAESSAGAAATAALAAGMTAAETTAGVEAGEIRTRDGVTLFSRSWHPAGRPWADVLLIHGIAEHLGRYERIAGLLAAAGLDVHGFDLRGHGRSGGRRVYVERWEIFLDDVEDLVSRSRTTPAAAGSRLPMVLMGHSMGALIALTYACSDRPAPDLLVLSAPPLDARVPRWQRAVAPILSRLAPTYVIENPIDGAQLSRDPAVGDAYFADPLVQPRSTARLGRELLAAGSRARRDLRCLRVPTLVIHGGDDTLVPTYVSEPLGRVPGVERRVLPGLRHETMNEPEGPEVVASIVAWLEDRLGEPSGTQA